MVKKKNDNPDKDILLGRNFPGPDTVLDNEDERKDIQKIDFTQLGPVAAFYSICKALEERNKEIARQIKLNRLEIESFKMRSFEFRNMPLTHTVDATFGFYDHILKNQEEVIRSAKEVFEVLKQNFEGEE